MANWDDSAWLGWVGNNGKFHDEDDNINNDVSQAGLERHVDLTGADLWAPSGSLTGPSYGPNDFNYGVLPASQYGGLMNSSKEGYAVQMQLENSIASPTFLPASLGTQSNRRLAREGWTKEEDNLLLARRREGWEYSKIAEEMRTMFGVDKTENCLVKRLGKIQEQYLDPLPEAVKKAMPNIVASIKDQMEAMGLDVSGRDKEIEDQVMLELPRRLPKLIQNMVMSKRKAMLGTSLTRS